MFNFIFLFDFCVDLELPKSFFLYRWTMSEDANQTGFIWEKPTKHSFFLCASVLPKYQQQLSKLTNKNGIVMPNEIEET